MGKVPTSLGKTLAGYLLNKRNATRQTNMVSEMTSEVSAWESLATIPRPRHAIAPVPISSPLNPANMFVKLHTIAKKIGRLKRYRIPKFTPNRYGLQKGTKTIPIKESETIFSFGDNCLK